MYSLVNIIGLALSLACVITIFRYLHGEMTVDRFNNKLDRMYVTTVEISTTPGEVRFSGIFNPGRNTSFVDLTEHPGVEKFSHFALFENDEIEVDERKYDAIILVADSNFLNVTGYPVISGVDKLSEPNTVMITKKYAHKLFGNENPVGKTFRHSYGKILTITGVIGQIPTKSTLAYDMIVSYKLTELNSLRPNTFVLLYPGVDYQTVNKQYESFFEIRNRQMRYQLFPFSKVYFDKSVLNVEFKQGNYNYVKILMAVGGLLLFIGIINYINIYTVVILRRGREFGVKKVFGAGGYNILTQLFVENLLMTAFALITALYKINLFARKFKALKFVCRKFAAYCVVSYKSVSARVFFYFPGFWFADVFKKFGAYLERDNSGKKCGISSQ